jgi:hypothetical protein
MLRNLKYVFFCCVVIIMSSFKWYEKDSMLFTSENNIIAEPSEAPLFSLNYNLLSEVCSLSEVCNLRPSNLQQKAILEKAKADLKKMNTLYAITPSYSLDIQYMVFDNHINGNLIENKPGRYVKYKDATYAKLLGIETISSSKNTIVVNNEDAFLVIAEPKKGASSPVQANIDSVLNNCIDVKVNDVGKTERHYILEFDDSEFSEISRMDIYLNLSNYSLKKLVMFYNQSMQLDQNDYYAEEKKPRLEIIYKSFKQMPEVNQVIVDLFNPSNYVLETGDTYKPSKKYSSYKVINQLNAYRFKKK